MQQPCTKEIKDLVWLYRKSDPQGIVPETEIGPYYQIVYA